MKFAILGDDDQTLLLAEGIIAAPNHELAWAGDISDLPRFAKIAPQISPSENWETLLESATIDAIIIGAANPADEFRREDQLRKFAQGNLPLVISHPVAPSMLLHYELDMIRQETLCPMIPLLPAVQHPGFAELCDLYQSQNDNSSGWQQIVFQRWMSERNKSTVEAQFARDVAMIRLLVGDITELSAKGTYQGETLDDRKQAYSNLGIQLTGPAGILIRWSVEPAVEFEGGSLNLLSSDQKIALQMPIASNEWSLESKASEENTRSTYEDFDLVEQTVKSIETAISQQTARPSWIDAARAAEISESIDTSLRRNRTVLFYNEVYTEDGSFKGFMSMLGCGLLLITLFLFGVLAMVEFIAKELGFKSIINILDIWPYLLFAILFLFLMSQFFRLAARKSPDD